MELEGGSLASPTNSAALAGPEARIAASSGLDKQFCSFLTSSPEEVEVESISEKKQPSLKFHIKAPHMRDICRVVSLQLRKAFHFFQSCTLWWQVHGNTRTLLIQSLRIRAT